MKRTMINSKKAVNSDELLFRRLQSEIVYFMWKASDGEEKQNKETFV